ncbi:MAG: hypothetical protein R3B99_00170 [Polyangiales bacterium]
MDSSDFMRPGGASSTGKRRVEGRSTSEGILLSDETAVRLVDGEAGFLDDGPPLLGELVGVHTAATGLELFDQRASGGSVLVERVRLDGSDRTLVFAGSAPRPHRNVGMETAFFEESGGRATLVYPGLTRFFTTFIAQWTRLVLEEP